MGLKEKVVDWEVEVVVSGWVDEAEEKHRQAMEWKRDERSVKLNDIEMIGTVGREC